MHNTRIVSVLKTLSTKEFTNFVKFVRSPFYNTHEKLVELIEILQKDYPKFTSDRISKENLLKKLYPTEAYTELKINHFSSYLLKLLEDYLSYLNYTRHDIVYKYHLANELRTRKLYPHFESILREMRDIQEAVKYKDFDFYYNQYNLEKETELYSSDQGVMKQDQSMQDQMDNFDIYYILTKLRNTCSMLNQKGIITTDYKLNMVEEIMNYLGYNNKKFQEVPLINIYYNIFMLLVKPTEENYYQKLKELLQENRLTYGVDVLREMYMYAQNYCVQKVNMGRNEYLKELFNLNITLTEEKIVFIDGYLPQRVYENTVRLGLRMNEVQWTFNFIENYKNYLSPEIRNNAYTYNLATFYYENKEYEKSLKLLNKVEFTDLFYNLGSKSLLLKIYYDTNAIEPFLSLSDAFKIYLKRNKLISSPRVTSYSNYVRFVKSVFNLKLQMFSYGNDIKEDKLKRVEQKIRETEPVANKKWVLEQIEKLKPA